MADIVDVASRRKQSPSQGRRNSTEHVRGQWLLTTMVRKMTDQDEASRHNVTVWRVAAPAEEIEIN
jgi:hypothetical protein